MLENPGLLFVAVPKQAYNDFLKMFFVAVVGSIVPIECQSLSLPQMTVK